MSKLKTIFGDRVGSLDVVVKNALPLAKPMWYKQYFDTGVPSTTLNYSSIIGETRIQAAAEIVDRGANIPIHGRQGLTTVSGEVPAIKVARAMKESDYRDWLNLRSLPGITDQVKFSTALDHIWNDVAYCGDGCHLRVNMMALQAVSTGYININILNNPGGLVLPQVDLLMSADNRKQAATSWADAENAKPLNDIRVVVKAGRIIGNTYAKMLMTDVLFDKLIATKEIIDSLKGFFYGPKPGAGFDPMAVTTLDNVNAFLAKNRLPIIEIVDESVGIMKDGKTTPTNFFDENNVTFIPAGKLGTIKNSLALEKLEPVEHVQYADYNGVLISKWKQNNPFMEWTAGEWNAMPAFEAIDQSAILKAVFV